MLKEYNIDNFFLSFDSFYAFGLLGVTSCDENKAEWKIEMKFLTSFFSFKLISAMLYKPFCYIKNQRITSVLYKPKRSSALCIFTVNF